MAITLMNKALLQVWRSYDRLTGLVRLERLDGPRALKGLQEVSKQKGLNGLLLTLYGDCGVQAHLVGCSNQQIVIHFGSCRVRQKTVYIPFRDLILSLIELRLNRTDLAVYIFSN